MSTSDHESVDRAVQRAEEQQSARDQRLRRFKESYLRAQEQRLARYRGVPARTPLSERSKWFDQGRAGTPPYPPTLLDPRPDDGIPAEPPLCTCSQADVGFGVRVWVLCAVVVAVIAALVAVAAFRGGAR